VAELFLERNLLGTDVLAGEQAHAAENALVRADDVEVFLFRAFVAGVEDEPGQPVQGHGPEEVRAHERRAAGRHAAAAFDAAVELVDLFGQRVVHAGFLGARVERLFRVHPGLHLLVHAAKPGAGVHGQVAHQLEDRQGHERDFVRQVLSFGVAGQARPTVDDHGAGPADAGPAAEIEHQRRVEFLPDAIERDEKRHALGLVQLEFVHVGLRIRIGRIVAEYIEGERSAHARHSLRCYASPHIPPSRGSGGDAPPRPPEASLFPASAEASSLPNFRLLQPQGTRAWARTFW